MVDDYRELLTRARYMQDEPWDIIIDMSDAIETLIAERNSAIADLESICKDSGDACYLCKHMPCAPEHDHCIGWEYKGTGKSVND